MLWEAEVKYSNLLKRYRLVTYSHRHPDDYSASAACAASLGAPRSRRQPFSQSPGVIQMTYPALQTNRGQLKLTVWMTGKLRVSQSLLPNKLHSKKSISSPKKIGLYLQEMLSAINTLISSANNKILHNLIMYFFPFILGQAYAKQIVCEIFFAHPQHRILTIWKHRKDCQSLKSSCFHSSFRFQINSSGYMLITHVSRRSLTAPGPLW